MLFRERPLKEILFGKTVRLAPSEKEVLRWIQENPGLFRAGGGRTGTLTKIDPIHKGSGAVYLLPNRLGDERNESLVLFDDDAKITNGPDLWVYLSSSADVKHEGLGEHLVLTLIKGNRGGQSYVVHQPIAELLRYKSVVIWCKQFSVLFSYAPLSPR